MPTPGNGISIRIEGSLTPGERCLTPREGSLTPHERCLTPYAEGLRLQRELHAARCAGEIGDTILFVEHPPVYTFGRSSDAGHLLWNRETLEAKGIELVETDRGGDVTFHGPGQIVAYPIVDLVARGLGVRDYVFRLEQAVIDTLAACGLPAGRDPRNRGVWIGNAKICAIGIRVSRHVTLHGLALNVNTDLAYFSGFVPCGLADADVTSLAEELGSPQDMDAVRGILVENLVKQLGS